MTCNSCNSCKYGDKGMDEYPCNTCVHNAVERYEPMTNFERIQKMSIEELAEFLCGVYDEDEDNAKYINGTIIPAYSEDDIREWLERKAD